MLAGDPTGLSILKLSSFICRTVLVNFTILAEKKEEAKIAKSLLNQKPA